MTISFYLPIRIIENSDNRCPDDWALTVLTAHERSTRETWWQCHIYSKRNSAVHVIARSFSYSGAQPQVYKRVRVTLITRECQTRVWASTCKRCLSHAWVETRERYIRVYSWVLANEHASTRNRTHNLTREYSQSNSRALAIKLEYSQLSLRVLAITCVGSNFRGCVTYSF